VRTKTTAGFNSSDINGDALEEERLAATDSLSSLQKKQQIKERWESASINETDAEGLRPTARDPYLQAAVENGILRYLPHVKKLLDIGCGEGTSTAQFASRADFTLGVDYSEGLITQALKKHHNTPRLSFALGDVCDLSLVRKKNGVFNAAISIRCLINLPSWKMQAKAIEEIALCIQPGGLLLITEGWKEGWEQLNISRTRAGLESITVSDYNLLIERRRFERHAGIFFDIINYHSLGLYLFMSRIVQPVFVAPNPPSHTHEINRLASDLQCYLGAEQRFGDIDYAGIYVLRRK
jgi:SAM-dependent methyltransferase